jgi:hypothetical protein
MEILADQAQMFFLGYAGIFLCLSIGFIYFKILDSREQAITLWIVSLLMNCLGFVFWAAVIPISNIWNYTLGEIAHVSGFFLIIIGAFRYVRAGKTFVYRIGLCGLSVLWLFSFYLFPIDQSLAVIIRKAIRLVLFIISGLILLKLGRSKKIIGADIASVSLVVCGIFLAISFFIKINYYIYYGILVGLHVLIALSMVAMITVKSLRKAEEYESRIEKLEGILPMCAYCKRIRDKENRWHVLEEYIEDRSNAEFSHGICPDCFTKYKPDK